MKIVSHLVKIWFKEFWSYALSMTIFKEGSSNGNKIGWTSPQKLCHTVLRSFPVFQSSLPSVPAKPKPQQEWELLLFHWRSKLTAIILTAQVRFQEDLWNNTKTVEHCYQLLLPIRGIHKLPNASDLIHDSEQGALFCCTMKLHLR